MTRARIDIDVLANRVLDGDISAETAKAELSTAYASLNTVRAKLTTMRQLIMDKSPPVDAGALLHTRDVDPEEVRAFCTATRKEQLATQRQHARHRTWGARAEEALASLEIVPACMAGLALTRQEAMQVQRASEAQVLNANCNPFVIEHTDVLLAQIEERMRAARVDDPLAELTVPLLLATGRRTVEIMNGVSTFAPVEGEKYHCTFDGQRKKRDAKPYIIPLLVPYDVVRHAIDVLRTKQKHARLTERQSKDRYQSSLRKGLLKMIAQERLALPRITVHTCRKIYTACVGKLFDSPYTHNATAMSVCGHATIKDSLAYSCVKLRGVEGEGRLGKLLVDTLCHEEDDSE